MTEPIRIRTTLAKDVAEVKVIIRHPMESGLRRDDSGERIPPHFIETLEIRCNDRVVFDAYLGMAISENPFIQFSFSPAAKGDTLEVTWKDNRGESRTDKGQIN